jgi:phosphoenolpyruvate carboxylase
MKTEQFPQPRKNEPNGGDKTNKKENQDINQKEEGVALNNILKELSEEDALLVVEEFKILQRADIANLKTKISNASGKDLEKPGGEDKLDKLLEELSDKQKALENLKKYLLNKDINSIKAYRDERIRGYLNEKGSYSLTGEEYHKNEDDFNRKLEEENEKNKIRDEINRLSKLN